MPVLSRFLREPLVHFIAIGAVVFGLYLIFGDEDEEIARGQIVVTEGRVQQLAQIFAKTWQRPPTPTELRGLIDAFVKEEVYYREAVKLGLDRDDTLIRRRMQQKMEFLTEPGEDALNADDATLQAFLEKNAADFRVLPRVAFEQVYIKAKPGDETATARARETLVALQSGGDPGTLGDSTLLPKTVKLSAVDVIGREFGKAFADEVAELPLSKWSGPVESPYGLHLVRVSERKDGYDPELAEVRDAVALKWRTETRKAHQLEAYEKLLANYDVVLPAPKVEGTSAEAGQ